MYVQYTICVQEVKILFLGSFFEDLVKYFKDGIFCTIDLKTEED